MILADTTVWIDHLRRSDPLLQQMLDADQVLMHPFVIGELALGHLHQRELILATLAELPAVHISDPEDILVLIGRKHLIAVGVGYVDVHLLASVLTTDECHLWTRDKRLARIAARLGVGANPVN